MNLEIKFFSLVIRSFAIAGEMNDENDEEYIRYSMLIIEFLNRSPSISFDYKIIKDMFQ